MIRALLTVANKLESLDVFVIQCSVSITVLYLIAQKANHKCLK